MNKKYYIHMYSQYDYVLENQLVTHDNNRKRVIACVSAFHSDKLGVALKIKCYHNTNMNPNCCMHEGDLEYYVDEHRFCDDCGYIGPYQIIPEFFGPYKETKPRTLVDKDVLLDPLYGLDMDTCDIEPVNELYMRVERAYHKSSFKAKNRKCVLALCFHDYLCDGKPLEFYADVMHVKMCDVRKWEELYHQANPNTTKRAPLQENGWYSE